MHHIYVLNHKVDMSASAVICGISVSSEIAGPFFSLSWVDYLHTNLVSVILLNEILGWAQPAALAVSSLHNRLNEQRVCALHC